MPPRARPHNAPMARRRRSSLHRIETYSDQTQRPLNSLWFVLPVLLTFHIGTQFYGTRLMAPRDIASLLRYFGADAWWFLPGVAVVFVLLLQHAFQRRRYTWRPKVFLGMLVESLLEIIPLISLNHLTGMVAAQLAAGAAQPGDLFEHVLIALGAGLYEEFIFRLVFINVALLVLVDLLGVQQRIGAPIAVVLGATLFSMYHFGAGENSFAWVPFVFRTLAGCYLGAIFVFRGFGIAVGTHVFWNLYTMLYRL